MKRTLTAALVALTLGAANVAQPAEAGEGEFFGTIIGGAAGGFLGSHIGSGDGRLAATAAGTLIGAALGNEFGSNNDRYSRYRVVNAPRYERAPRYRYRRIATAPKPVVKKKVVVNNYYYIASDGDRDRKRWERRERRRIKAWKKYRKQQREFCWRHPRACQAAQ